MPALHGTNIAHTHHKGMQAIVSQADVVQAQTAERAAAEEKETEAALQKAQDQEVGSQPVTHLSALARMQALQGLTHKLTYYRAVAHAWPKELPDY